MHIFNFPPILLPFHSTSSGIKNAHRGIKRPQNLVFVEEKQFS